MDNSGWCYLTWINWTQLSSLYSVGQGWPLLEGGSQPPSCDHGSLPYTVVSDQSTGNVLVLSNIMAPAPFIVSLKLHILSYSKDIKNWLSFMTNILTKPISCMKLYHNPSWLYFQFQSQTWSHTKSDIGKMAVTDYYLGVMGITHMQSCQVSHHMPVPFPLN